MPAGVPRGGVKFGKGQGFWFSLYDKLSRVAPAGIKPSLVKVRKNPTIETIDGDLCLRRYRWRAGKPYEHSASSNADLGCPKNEPGLPRSIDEVRS